MKKRNNFSLTAEMHHPSRAIVNHPSQPSMQSYRARPTNPFVELMIFLN